MEILDIKFRMEGLEKKLSNLYPYEFEIDGVSVASYEGFIQSLRTPDIQIKESIWKLSGFEAWKAGQCLDWIDKQELYWISTPINRQSNDYYNLITRSYDCLFEQNETFRNNLKESIPYKLDHTIGKSGKTNTLMTKSEFLIQLNRLRFKLTKKKFFNLLDLF